MRRVFESVLVILAVAAALLPFPRPAVERIYSRGVYPLIQPRLTAFSNHLNLALFDVALVGVLVVVVAIWIAGFSTAPRGRRLRALGGVLLDTAAMGAFLYFWFLAGWGLNYQRQPLRTMLEFHDDRITADALRDLSVRDIKALNELFDAAHAQGWPELVDLPPVLHPLFVAVQHDLGMAWRAAPGRPKRSMIDFYFRRVSVDGMTDPFFLETLANQSLLPFERPYVIAHEWSHLAGYADESEANFFSWLMCMRGGAPEQYSAWISLYGTIVSALPPGDRDGIVNALQPGPRGDLRAMAERIARQVNPAASRAGYAVYDRFLKANRVRAGIRSYNEVIRLMLGTQFREDGTPVLKSVRAEG